MKRPRIAYTVVGGIVLVGLLLGFARPKWVFRIEQISEDDCMRQTDQKWFGVIPNSVIERDASLAVRPVVLAELARLVKHPASVDTTKIDFLQRTVYPGKSRYVRLNVKGNLKAIIGEYAKQLSSARSVAMGRIDYRRGGRNLRRRDEAESYALGFHSLGPPL